MLGGEEPTMVGTVLVVSGLIVALVLCAILGRRKRLGFEERFPPISDAEFVTRCRPGTNAEVALKVRATVADSLGVDYERVYPSSRLIEDLGAD
jgi:hypothetical protein